MLTFDGRVEAVDRFFESYRQAFEGSDATAGADHFVYPAHIASDNDKIALLPVAARDQWEQQIEQLLGVYARIGVKSAHVLERVVAELSPRL